MSLTSFVLKLAAPIPDIESYDSFLFIGPHPDDIEIGAGATVAKLCAAGKRVGFLTCIDGRFGDCNAPVQGDELAEIIVFLKEWQTVLQERLSKADKERAKQSKILRLEGMKELRKNKTVVRTGYLSGKLLADVLEADLIDITFEEQEEKKEVV